MIGIIIAMDKELEPFLGGNSLRKKTKDGLDFYLGKICAKKCVIVNSGIGKVNAAYATLSLIKNYKPDEIISIGVSGGLGKSNVLDIVVSASCVQYDVDTSALGDEIGFVSTVNKIYFDCDRRLVDDLVKCSNAKKGVFACGDRFVADEKTRDFIVNSFDAISCDMESGAIAQVCFRANVPFAALRCISDGAGENAAMSYEEVVCEASAKLYATLVRYLSRN